MSKLTLRKGIVSFVWNKLLNGSYERLAVIDYTGKRPIIKRK